VAADFEAFECRLDEKCRHSLPARGRIRFRKDDVDACVGAVSDPSFSAVEFVAMAFARCRGLGACGVGAGGGFCEAEGAEDFSGGEAFQISLLLCVAAELVERRLYGGVGHAERGGHGGVNARDLFEHQDVGDGVHASAAPLFGREHATAAHFAELLQEVEGKSFFALEFFDERTDFGFHELPYRVTD
jgi:hypothetical protein